MDNEEAKIYIKAIGASLYETGKNSPYRDELIPKMKEACGVALKALEYKPIMGKCIANKFIALTCGSSKTYVRADRITQMYEATENRTHIFLDGSDVPVIVKDSMDEIFTKIGEIY